MAFPFFGGDKSPLAKLQAGKLKDDEKAQLLAALTSAPPSPTELIPLVFSDDSAINQRAQQLFLNKVDAEATTALVDELFTRPTGFALGVAVLKKCKDELVIKALDPHMARPRPDLARKLWELTLDLQPSISDKYLERAIQEAPSQQRVIALKRLIKARGAESIRAILIESSSNREVAVRKEAVTTLANLPGEDVFAVMLDRLGADDSKDLRDFAGKYLQQYIFKAPPDVRPRVLGKLLLAGDPEQRKNLVQSMFSEGKPDELLTGVLLFCKTLTGVPHRTVMESLTAVGDKLIAPTFAILKSTDADLRVQAVYLLEAFADPKTVVPLLAMLRDTDWWVRIVVCETLGRIKEPKIIDSLRQMFSDTDAKWAAIEAVGKIGGDGAVTALLPLLGDPSAEVRASVVNTLRQVPDPRVEKALTDVTLKDTSIDVKLKAVEALRELKGGEAGKGSGAVVSSKELNKPLEKMLAYMRERNGSDLHITPGEPPIIRVNGVLERLASNKIDADNAKTALWEILDAVRLPVLEDHGAVDLCYTIPGVGRYRANVFKMKRGYAGVFRTIPNRPPTFAELGLPKHLADIGTYHQGIVLVTGPAGSGKTTTMSALVNVVNETRAAHVITFEDPVEFIHTSKKALINQREIGKDSKSYAAAMRGALREDPDIIVVGDMRDPETIRLALLAAETGHLVVATMQTTGAAATIDKLVESFPADEQQQVRVGLSESLKLVVSQILVPRADGQARVAIFEVLKSTSPVRSQIRDGKTFQLASTMTIGRSVGMQTIDGALEERLRAGAITFEVGLAASQNKENFSKLRTVTPQAAAPPAASPPTTPGAPTTGTNPAHKPVTGANPAHKPGTGNTPMHRPGAPAAVAAPAAARPGAAPAAARPGQPPAGPPGPAVRKG